MSEQEKTERPVLNGLVALAAVALGVGLVLALVALAGTKVLGLGGSDGEVAADSTVGDSMYLPSPVATEEPSGPLVTLNTDEAEQSSDAASESESEEPTETTSAPPKDEITLQAAANAVAPGERIYFSGVYPTGEGAILWVQRFEDGKWADFPASVGVTNGTFSTYVFTGISGVNRFRVINRDNGLASNEIKVQVG